MSFSIKSPNKIERFFEYPVDARIYGSTALHYVQSNGRNFRMSALGKNAFCATIEGLVERAVLPTINYKNLAIPEGRLEDSLRNIQQDWQNKLMFDCGSFVSRSYREKIKDRLFRFFDKGLLNELVAGVFTLFFSDNIFTSSTGYNPPLESVTVYPFGAEDFKCQIELADSDHFIMEYPETTADMEWDSSLCMWYEPLTKRKDKVHLLYAEIRSAMKDVGIVEEKIKVAPIPYDFSSVLSDDLTLMLYNDRVKNFWERPGNRYAYLKEGPLLRTIKNRRCSEMWGILQAMLASMAYSYFTCGVKMDFNIKHQWKKKRWLYSYDDEGEAVYTIIEDDEGEDEEPHDRHAFWRRERELGVYTALLSFVSPCEISKDDPLVRSKTELQSLNPRFESGSLVYIPYSTIGSSIYLDTDSESGWPGTIVSRSEVRFPVPGFEEDIAVQDIYPHPLLVGREASAVTVNIIDRIDDSLDLSDKERPKPGGTRFMCFHNTDDTLRSAIHGHEQTVIDQSGLDGCDLPEFVEPNFSALNGLIQKFINQCSFMYSIAGISWEEDGETYYLPYRVENELQYQGGDFKRESEQMAFAKFQMNIAPDLDELWRGENGIDGWATHEHSKIFGSVKWNFQAMPIEN